MSQSVLLQPERGYLSDWIRERAVKRYVQPAMEKGQETFTIAIKDHMHELEAEGFPSNHPNQFCTALQKQSFLKEYGLEIDHIEGPPSKRSTTVVLHYRMKRQGTRGGVTPPPLHEDPAARAKRLTESIRGLLKKELKAYGGAEGFIRWTRSEDDAA